MKWINESDMKRQIFEMWDALSCSSFIDDQEHETAWSQCVTAEKNLKEEYLRQQLLKELSPEMAELFLAIKKEFDDNDFFIQPTEGHFAGVAFSFLQKLAPQIEEICKKIPYEPGFTK